MRKSIFGTKVMVGALALLVVVFATGCPRHTATLSVWNNTDKTITEVYCTPVTNEYWGDNLISTDIAPGETRDITGFDPDEYDMLAVFSDTTEAENDSVTFDPDETYTWNVLLSLPSGKSTPTARDETGALVK
jgi:hypothetical protein